MKPLVKALTALLEQWAEDLRNRADATHLTWYARGFEDGIEHARLREENQ